MTRVDAAHLEPERERLIDEYQYAGLRLGDRLEVLRYYAKVFRMTWQKLFREVRPQIMFP